MSAQVRIETAIRSATRVAMLERASASPSMIRAIFKAGMESDIREVLTAVSAPTVVMMTRDGPQSEAVVREVADLLPNSQFHVLPASTESDGLEGLFAPIIDLVERLVTGATATQTGVVSWPPFSSLTSSVRPRRRPSRAVTAGAACLTATSPS
jgi:hypothetical protein